MIDRTPRIPSAKDAAPLWAEYLCTRSPVLKNRLVELHIRIVHVRAGMLAARLPLEVDIGDLVQWGSLGLMRAVETFEPSRGFRFTTFAGRRVSGAMVDGLREASIHGRNAMTYAKILSAAGKVLQNELGRHPSPEEVARHLGLDDKTFQSLERRKACHIESLAAVVSENDSRKTSRGDLLKDPRADDPQARAEIADSVQSIIDWALNKMRVTDVLIIRLYYLDNLTMDQVGEIMMLSSSRISQVLKLAMARLQANFRKAA